MLVVGLDIVVALGQEVGKLAVHFDIPGLIAPEDRRNRQSDEIRKTVSPENCQIGFDDTVGGAFWVTWGGMGHVIPPYASRGVAVCE